MCVCERVLHSFPAGGECSKESDVDDREGERRDRGSREGAMDVNTGAAHWRASITPRDGSRTQSA